MPQRQPLPHLWLISDKRNDASLEMALRHLPRGSAFVFRHYHLAPEKRRARFLRLSRLARSRGHLVILADNAATAKAWGARGVYGAPSALDARRSGLLAIATVHNMHELAQAHRIGADAAMLSPVFATRSHPGEHTLGPARFRLLARHATMPVIALGGMTWQRASQLSWCRWAAIDGLSNGPHRRYP